LNYLPNTFKCEPLSREPINGQRLYLLPDGSKLPSVTTILDKTKPHGAKRKLENWITNVGTDQADCIKRDASDRGTLMHSYLEHYVEHGVMHGCDLSHKMAETIVQNGFHRISTVFGQEVPLYFPGIYAGTSDLVCEHDGVIIIGDYKQSNKPKKREWIGDYFMQIAAYAEAHNEIHGTNISRGVIFMCTPSLEYQEFILEGRGFIKFRNMWWDRVTRYYQNFA